jgi:hypothetical protein
MRIQETNEILNEARVMRHAHGNQDDVTSKRSWKNTLRGWTSGVPGMLRDRRVQYGIAGVVAAAIGVATYNRTRGGRKLSLR